MRFRAIAVAGLAVVAIAGCGSTGVPATVPVAINAPGGAPTGIVTTATLAVGGTNKQYVTVTGPLIAINGYFKARLAAVNTPAKWLHTQSLAGSFAQKELALLNRDGFKVGVAEDLFNKSAHISTAAQQFAASVGPIDAVALEASQLKAQSGAKQFNVPGIAGAIGYLAGGRTEIAFASGDYYIHLSRNATSKAAISQLTGVASTIYKQLQA